MLPKGAKVLARYSTITLTMDRYAHVTLKDTAAAFSKLTGPASGKSGAGAAPGIADGGNGRDRTEVIENPDPQTRPPRPSSNPLR